MMSWDSDWFRAAALAAGGSVPDERKTLLSCSALSLAVFSFLLLLALRSSSNDLLSNRFKTVALQALYHPPRMSIASVQTVFPIQLSAEWMSKQSQPAVAPPKKKRRLRYIVRRFNRCRFFSSVAVAAGAALLSSLYFTNNSYNELQTGSYLLNFTQTNKEENKCLAGKNKVFSSSTTARYAPERIVTLSCHP